MARYRVNTRFVFSGVFEVEADSRTEARELVKKECGLVMGGSIHTTLDDEEVDWDFYKCVLPIPEDQFIFSPEMEQNPGYPKS